MDCQNVFELWWFIIGPPCCTHASLLHHHCCAALLSFCPTGLLLPVVLPLSLASLLRVPLLADCCVHPPLLSPPAAITKKSLCHHTPRRECVMSSTPLLLSALSSFCCAGWLLHNILPLLLASLPLLCPCQCPCCTGIIVVIALASLPLLPPTLPSSIAAVKQIFAEHPSFGWLLCSWCIVLMVQQMIRSGVVWRKMTVPTTKVPRRKTTLCIPVAVRRW